MKKITNSWPFDCTAERFWQVYMNPDYSKALYSEALEFKTYKVLHSDENSRKLYLAPKLNLPGPLAKLIGDSFAYEQHATLDRQSGLWRWEMVQPGDPKKKGMVTSAGTICVASNGEGKCTRSDEVNVTANVFGLGGMIESTVEKEVQRTWALEVAFMKRWIAEKN